MLQTAQRAGEREGQPVGGSDAPGRYALVDVMRGVSILLVILLHVQILLACWALGALVERWLSTPANRWLRRELASRGVPDSDAVAVREHRASLQ